MASPAKGLGQGDEVLLHGRIVHLRNGVARVQVCRQLLYCLTEDLEPCSAPDKAVTRPPETRAVSGPDNTMTIRRENKGTR